MLSHFTIRDLLQCIHADVASCESGQQALLEKGPVLQIGTDTRTLQRGSIFAAIRGERFDGHGFLKEAADRGAVAAIVEKQRIQGKAPLPVFIVDNSVVALAQVASHLRQRFSGPVCAVTGSAGKSSTKNMLGALLGEHTLTAPKSYNNLLGVSQTLFLMDDTTRKVVLEMGMNARGEIAEMCGFFRPDFAIITNIGTAHIGRLGGKEQIFAAKKELFESIAQSAAAGAKKPLGVAINQDDPWVVRAAQETIANHRQVSRVTYSGTGKAADVRVVTQSLDPKTGHLRAEIEISGALYQAQLPVFGLHQAENLAAAVAGALLMGVPASVIAGRFTAIRSGEHRGETTQSPRGVFVVDESYNSNPSALRESLRSIFQLSPSNRHVLVLGEMKELEAFSDELHDQVGSDLVALLKARPVPTVLIGVGAGFAPFVGRVQKDLSSVLSHQVGDASGAIRLLESMLRAGDVVLVKGSRGIELDKVVTWLKTEP